MSLSTIIAVVAYSLSALGFAGFAASFGLRQEWEPWHGQATGKKWLDLSREMQIVILSIMRATAAGGAALAVATAFFVYLLIMGNPLARWALPAVTLTFAIPAAAVALRFRNSTSANPPLGPAILGVVFPVIGLIASLF